MNISELNGTYFLQVNGVMISGSSLAALIANALLEDLVELEEITEIE